MSEVDHPDYYVPVPSPAVGPAWSPPSPAQFQPAQFQPAQPAPFQREPSQPAPFQPEPFKPDSGRAGPTGWRRVTSGLAALGAFLAKFGAVIVKLKYAGVLISMFVSIAAYAWLWGWTFAIGFVALLFVHEMGHWVEIRRQGIPASKPTFIPFLGALISMRGLPANAYQEARVALAGPAAGTAASIVVALWSAHTGSGFLQALAYIGFFLNLFNLLPALPLDGGRAVGALHPAIWLAGLVGLVLVEAWRPSPVIPLILILGAFELYRRWRGRNAPAARTYYELTGSQRGIVAAAYLGLVAITIYGAHATYVLRHFK